MLYRHNEQRSLPKEQTIARWDFAIETHQWRHQHSSRSASHLRSQRSVCGIHQSYSSTIEATPTTPLKEAGPPFSASLKSSAMQSSLTYTIRRDAINQCTALITLSVQCTGSRGLHSFTDWLGNQCTGALILHWLDNHVMPSEWYAKMQGVTIFRKLGRGGPCRHSDLSTVIHVHGIVPHRRSRRCC